MVVDTIHGAQCSDRDVSQSYKSQEEHHGAQSAVGDSLSKAMGLAGWSGRRDNGD